MTAPTLNIAATAPPGAASAAGAAGQAAGAGGQLAGFEALLAALFPAGQPGAAATAASPLAPAKDGKLAVEGKTDEAGDPDADSDAASTEADPGDPQGLAACMLATPQPTIDALLLAKAARADGQAGLTSGKTVPGTTVPTLPGTSELAPDAEDAGADAGATLTDPTAKGAKPVDAAPPAWGRTKAAGAPAQPALENANPKADLAAKAAAAEADAPVEVPAAPAEVTPAPQAAVDASKLPATPALAAKPEPAPVKTAKSERGGKGSSETAAVDGLRPKEAVDKPVHARAAEGAAKAASTTVEAAEPEAREAKADADHNDATQPGETRSTTASTAPTAHTAHPVRGAPETVANLAAQIIKKLEAKTTRFDLELDPQGLGRVDVRVEIGAHGKMTASMVFENPQAAHELKARAAELQRVLEQAGFDLSGGLSFDVADQGRQQGQAWQDQGDSGRAFRGQAFRAALETAGDAADAANHGALRLRRGVNAGVDVRI